MNCPRCNYKIKPGAALVKHRNKSMSPERRREIAIKAAEARWGKKPAKPS